MCLAVCAVGGQTGFSSWIGHGYERKKVVKADTMVLVCAAGRMELPIGLP